MTASDNDKSTRERRRREAIVMDDFTFVTGGERGERGNI